MKLHQDNSKKRYFINFSGAKFLIFSNLFGLRRCRRIRPIPFMNLPFAIYLSLRSRNTFVWGCSFSKNLIWRLFCFIFTKKCRYVNFIEDGLLKTSMNDKSFSYMVTPFKPYYHYRKSDWHQLNLPSLKSFNDKSNFLFDQNKDFLGKYSSQRDEIETNRKRSLIVGQVEGDMSLTKFPKKLRQNIEFIKYIQNKYPGEHLAFIMHPKNTDINKDQVSNYCDRNDIQIINAPKKINEKTVVHSRSSLLGIELFESGGNVIFHGGDCNWISEYIDFIEKSIPIVTKHDEVLTADNKFIIRQSLLSFVHLYPDIDNYDTEENKLSFVTYEQMSDLFLIYCYITDVRRHGWNLEMLYNNWALVNESNNKTTDDHLMLVHNKTKHKIKILDYNRLSLDVLYCSMSIRLPHAQQQFFCQLYRQLTHSKNIEYFTFVITDLAKLGDNITMFDEMKGCLSIYLSKMKENKASIRDFRVINACNMTFQFGFYELIPIAIAIVKKLYLISRFTDKNFSFGSKIKMLRGVFRFVIRCEALFYARSFSGDPYVNERVKFKKFIRQFHLDMKTILLRDSANEHVINALFTQAQGALVDSSNEIWTQPQKKKKRGVFGVIKHYLDTNLIKLSLILEIVRNNRGACIIDNSELNNLLINNLPYLNNKLSLDAVFYAMKLRNFDAIIDEISPSYLKNGLINPLIKKLLRSQFQGNVILNEYTNAARLFLNNNDKNNNTQCNGLVINVSGGCKNSLSMLVELTPNWTKLGYLVIDPFLNLKRRCLNSNNDSDISKKLSLDTDKQNLIENEINDLFNLSCGASLKLLPFIIDWERKEILYKNINYYQGVYERIATYLRRANISMKNQEELFSLKTELMRLSRFLRIHEKINIIAEITNKKIFVFMGNAHVSPYNAFRDSFSYAKYKLILCGLAYSRLFTGKLQNYSEEFKISLYSSCTSKRAPFLINKEEFETFIKNSSEVENFDKNKEKVLAHLNKKFKFDEVKPEFNNDKYKSWRANNKTGRVFKVIGKLAVDMGIPNDGGKIFNDHKAYILGINDFAKSNKNCFFIFRPHPQERTKEISLSLNDFVSDWVDDSLDNVIIADHVDISSKIILAHTDIALIYNGSAIPEYLAIGKKVCVFTKQAYIDYPLDIYEPSNLKELLTMKTHVSEEQSERALNLLTQYFFYDARYSCSAAKLSAHNLSVYTPSFEISGSNNEVNSNFELLDRQYREILN